MGKTDSLGNWNMAEIRLNQLYSHENVLNNKPSNQKERNKMNSAEILLVKKMLEAEPLLDLQGADCKLFQIAYQDFANYLKFSWNPAEGGAEDFDVAQRIEQYLSKDSAEVETFMHVWASMWLEKWKSRVKIFFGNDGKRELGQVAKTLADAEPLWGKLTCKEEMIEMVVATLIRYGEICGTEIFAPYILKVELGKMANMDVSNTEQLFALLNCALRRAHETAMRTGPLMYVKVDKAYFATVKQ
jgi:hypothetical protein